jgi:hypothetical protein
MSQAKVDRYKEEKKNRQKNLKKEKRHENLLKACGVLVACVIVGWVGYSGYSAYSGSTVAEGKTYSVDTTSLDNFMNNLSAETEAE